MSVTKMLPKMLRHLQVCAHHFPKLVGIFFLSQTRSVTVTYTAGGLIVRG